MARKKRVDLEDLEPRYIPRDTGQVCPCCHAGVLIDHDAVEVDDRGELFYLIWVTNSGRTLSKVRYTTCSNESCGAMYRGVTRRRAKDAELLFRDLQHARHRRRPWKKKRSRSHRG